MDNVGIGSWPQRRRIKSGPKSAIIARHRRLTYDDLAERTDRLAQALRQRGVAPGDRVAYLGDNDPAFLETLFACGLAGAVFVPLNTRLAPPEIQFQLQDSGAVLLVHARSLAALAIPSVPETAVSLRVVVDDDPKREEEAPAADGEVSFEEFLASGAANHLDEHVELEDGAMILYTSGTTGRPKGALLTHGNITWNCVNVIVDVDFSSTDVALMISPMFHVASLNMGVLPTLLKGGTVILESKLDPARILPLIEQYRVTTVSGVPTTFQMLAEHPLWESTDISSLSKLTCGGSAVPLRVIEAYEERGLRFSNGYGMTETAPGATTLPAARSRDKVGSSGLPHFFTDVRIADAAGQPASQGDIGEIQVKGPNVISGYWNRPEASAEAFEDGGWFKSGDMGYTDDEGFLFVADRLKDMIISGGENIYPAEVEQLILELPAVTSAAVIGVEDEKWGEVPQAVVTLREGTTLAPEDITSHLAGRIARYKIPKSVVFVDEMPRTASGKIRKAALRKSLAGEE
jgi:fatty-acyl-CoA synthase